MEGRRPGDRSAQDQASGLIRLGEDLFSWGRSGWPSLFCFRSPLAKLLDCDGPTPLSTAIFDSSILHPAAFLRHFFPCLIRAFSLSFSRLAMGTWLTSSPLGSGFPVTPEKHVRNVAYGSIPSPAEYYETLFCRYPLPAPKLDFPERLQNG